MSESPGVDVLSASDTSNKDKDPSQMAGKYMCAYEKRR